jgi:ADP-ribose pyrophosphatase
MTARPGRREPDVELLSSEVRYRGRIFTVRHDHVRLPSGLEQRVDVVQHAGAVAVAALDDDGRLLLVRQYRQPVGDWLVEVPAGRLEQGEDALGAARRELEEETGFRAGRWTLVRRFWPAPGFCSEHMSLYLAQELEPVGDRRRPPDPDEEIELVRWSPEQVLASCQDAKTLVAAAHLLLGPPAA